MKISDWAILNDVKINPTRSHAIVFTKNSGLANKLPRLKVDGVDIEYVGSEKSLGMHLQGNLSWDKHISTVCGKIYGALATLRHSQTF